MHRTFALPAAIIAMTIGTASAQSPPSSPGATGTGPGTSAELTGTELRDYCVFNNAIFSQGIEICVRKGIAYRCGLEPKSTIATWQPVGNTCITGTEFPPP